MAEKIDISLLLDNMVDRLSSHCDARALKNPLMIGIQRGGVWVANQLYRKLGH